MQFGLQHMILFIHVLSQFIVKSNVINFCDSLKKNSEHTVAVYLTDSIFPFCYIQLLLKIIYYFYNSPELFTTQEEYQQFQNSEG